MTPAAIIREAQADGVRLALSLTGTLKATGDGAVVNRWLAVIREHKAEIIGVLKVGVGDTAPASRWWLIHYPDRDPLEVACCPEATHAEILERHPDAVAAEPSNTPVRLSASSITGDEERAVLRWLERIGETDPATIAEVLTACRRDIEARRYFLERAEWQSKNKTPADCASCRFRRSPGGVVRYCAGGRSDLPLAYGAGHPLRRLPDDQGRCCSRYSGLIQKGVE